MKPDRYNQQLWWLLQELETAARASYDEVVRYTIRTGHTDPSPQTQHDLLMTLVKDGAISFPGNEHEVRRMRPQKEYELRVDTERFREVYNLSSIYDEHADIGKVGEISVVNASQYRVGEPALTYQDNLLTVKDAVIKVRPDSRQDMLCRALFNSKKKHWYGIELYSKLDELYDENSADNDPVQLKMMWRRLQKSVNDLGQRIEKETGISKLIRAEAKQVHFDVTKLDT